MKKDEKKRMKIALFGHFGLTNFGNDSTLRATLHHLRSYYPDAEITCIATSPEAVTAAYQIQAIPISDNLLLRSWLPRNRLLRLLRTILIGIPSEPFRWINGFRQLRHSRAFIIPGTGLLTDASGLTGWGPYNLWKWSILAKICGCKLVFLSVGAGPVYSLLGRWFIKSALSVADYRSYRDDSTVQCLKDIGFSPGKDEVYPDLVFSLPLGATSRQFNRERDRPIVGLGLMTYAGRTSDPQPDNAIYLAYLEALANFVRWWIDQKNDVRLLIGDVWDESTTEEFTELLQKQLRGFDKTQIINEPVRSVDDLLSQIRDTDIVVATRFHNVLLSLMCEKPVISISFHHKCESLMNAMGLSAYCLDIHNLKTDQLIDRFCDAQTNAARLKTLIRERMHTFRTALDEQYSRVFNEVFGSPHGSAKLETENMNFVNKPDSTLRVQ